MYFSNRIAGSVLELIGHTPLIRLNRVVENDAAEILAKPEFLNPGGSVKDRIAQAMIEDAERSGLLASHSVVIEPTSGNTGIGLAMVCAVKGYRCIITMPETMSMERVYILKAYGAEVVLTPHADGMRGAIKKAQELYNRIPHSFMPQQFKHPANPRIHRDTTAREIIEQTGKRLDAFVAGVGTGGTITGVGEELKKLDPKIRIIAVEPRSSAVLSGRPAKPHKIQGIGAGFIPQVLNRDVIDEIVCVSDEEAYAAAKLLAKKEGIFAGPSSGAALVAALRSAAELGKGKTVVTVFPDTGERYFSMTQYFEF